MSWPLKLLRSLGRVILDLCAYSLCHSHIPYLRSLLFTSYVVINPRRACAARVTVVAGSVCVRVSVGPLSDISPLELLFILKTLSPTQRVKKFCSVFSKTHVFRRSIAPSL